MKAAVLREVGKPLQIEDVQINKPGPHEVLIRTVAAGLCHSDLHFMEGSYPHPLPAVLGHESAGIVEQVGAPLALYDDPDNMFVAGFIGSPRMNFLPAAVVAQAEGGQITVAIKARPDTQLTVACATPPKVGDAVTIGVRPEHFLPAGSGDTQMTAHVGVVEHLGNTSYVYAHTVPGEQIIIEQEERRNAGRYGDEIAVGISAKTSFLFDASGRRIR